MQRMKEIDLHDEEQVKNDKSKKKYEKIYFIDVNHMNMHFNLQADPAQFLLEN